ncbi:unnamed protein product, partial [Pelagomonas calceolata]
PRALRFDPPPARGLAFRARGLGLALRQRRRLLPPPLSRRRLVDGRVRGAEDQALDQLAQGGAVARFLGLFLFRLFGGIGVGWAPVAARRRRGGAGAGHAAHFVPQKECVCVGLLSAEPPLSWDARDSASAQLSVGRHSTNSYRSPRREGRFLPADPVGRASTAATGRRAREVGVAARPARRVHLRSSAAGSGRLRRAARAVSPGVSRARVEASE